MDWTTFNEAETKKPYYSELYGFLTDEYRDHTCYPPFGEVLNALALTPLDKVKCVIIGQDPYHNPGEAMGLAFSVRKGVKVPPSLVNIYQELHDEFGYPIPQHGDLTAWTQQGVLLLNSVLSVRAHSPASHGGHGWETYTDNVLRTVNEKQEPVVFMLWGRFAKSKRALVTNPRHLVLQATHPSPFSASSGFFGCNHFKQCNEFLERNGIAPIDWRVQ